MKSADLVSHINAIQHGLSSLQPPLRHDPPAHLLLVPLVDHVQPAQQNISCWALGEGGRLQPPRPLAGEVCVEDPPSCPFCICPMIV